MIYGREALRRFREDQEHPEKHSNRAADLLSQIPADAEMEDATICVWNGERFVAWERWVVTAPVIKDEQPQQQSPTREKNGKRKTADPRLQNISIQEGLW